MNYRSLHWGEPRRFEVSVGFATGPAVRVARLVSASYTTTKGGVSATWRHEFEGTQWLCRSDEAGDVVLPAYTQPLLCIGRAIDVFDDSGVRYAFPVGAYLATCAGEGSPLILAYEARALWALVGDAHVQNAGIMG